MNQHISRRSVLAGLGMFGLGLTVGPGSVTGTGERFIVGTSTPAATRAAEQRAASVHRVLNFGDIGAAVAGHFTSEALAALAMNPNVRYVEPDGLMYAISIDSGDAEVPWGVDRVDAEKVHAGGSTGNGAHVCIIDTGIDSNHPDLQSNVGTGVAFVKSRGPYAEDWDDDNGHGTHCAGIADAIDNDDGVVGVSTQATLHAVKVLDKNGSGRYSDVAAGIKWVGDQRYDVGSMSLGGPKSNTIKDACQYASDRGVLLVAAAGNESEDVENSAPATYATVMAVSATDNTDAFASFSNFGTDIEIAAPGVDVYSTYAGGGYQTLSGTSMACPHVSGAAGQVMAMGYSFTDARRRLTETAEDIGLSLAQQGSGLLDVEAAVSGSVDASPSVAWVTPSDGTQVSDTVTIQIDATDTEDADDALTVNYTVDAGTALETTYDSTSGYHEATWDSTVVADGAHDLTATATDTAGNTTTATVTVSTENTEDAPSVDDLTLSEIEVTDTDAEFDADWVVSDPESSLSSVDLVLQDASGTAIDSATMTVSGGTASGTTRLVDGGGDGSNETYTVELTVTDTSGLSATGTAAATETQVTNNPPAIDSYVVTEAGSPNPHFEVTADWAVSDTDGNLDTVVIEVLDGSTVVASATNVVTGASASGTDSFKVTHADGQTFDIVLTVTDLAGATVSRTETRTE